MEPYIIDYYNEMPSCYHTIEKLNTEFKTLQNEKDLLEDDILTFIPDRLNISYDEFLKSKKSSLLEVIARTNIAENLPRPKDLIKIKKNFIS